MKKIVHRSMSTTMVFILLFGVVSLFSDMTHESANSIRGAFLALAGASAAVIGFVSGLGELVGYGLRYVFGRLTDKTRRYWPMVLVGYTLDVLAVPALALVGRNGWVLACALLIVQRLGKAIKKPAKDTVMSFAATQEGVGKSFAIQELLDQIGAVLGPVLLYVIMLFQRRDDAFSDYRTCFAFLAIPGAITLLLLWLTYKKFPHPENFEPEPKEYVPFHVSKRFVVYILGISLFAFGFADYSLIVMHFSRHHLFTADVLPLMYALAMLTDAASAFVFGWMYDRHARLSLVLSTLVAAPFALFAFLGGSVASAVLGVVLWGIGMGAQESILKAAVTTMVPKRSRATGYGIFECCFGAAWFLGSWLLGVLYDRSLLAMVLVSVAAQLLAATMFCWKISK
jgi:MFS family permease